MKIASVTGLEKQILLADDSIEARCLIRNFLKDAPFELIEAANGVEAISALSKYRNIGLILMDMEMPVMDGYTAARIISSNYGGDRVPIIAMTAHDEEDAERCQLSGCCAYIKKPVSRNALLKLISEWLSQYKDALGEIEMETASADGVVHIDPDIASIVPGFLNNRRQDVARIISLLDKGDMDTIRIIGHSMAGSAGGYGFPEIGCIGKNIEVAALGGDVDRIRKHTLQLSEYLSNLKYRLSED